MPDVVAILMRHGILKSAREPLTMDEIEIVRRELADPAPPSTGAGPAYDIVPPLGRVFACSG